MANNLFGLDMRSSASRDPSNSLYVAVLQADGEHPFAPRDDDAESKDERRGGRPGDRGGDDAPKGDDGEREGDGESEDDGESDRGDRERGKKPELPAIDIAGIDQRIVALPLPSGRYSDLSCTKDALLYLERDGRNAELKSFDMKEREAKSLHKGVRSYELAANGRALLLSGSSGYSIAGTSGKETDRIDVDRVKVRVEPEKEWPQILREVWRIQRDFFYDPNMHGVDWPAMWDRWAAFLPHVRHRADLTLLVSEMIGELACGHQYTGGGDLPDAPEGVSTGLLGADFDTADGRFRIARIYRGQNWSSSMRAPLTEPGVDAREGDYLLAVDGRDLTADDNLYEAFQNSAGRRVTLTLAQSADGADARSVEVTPIPSESRLRRQSWIEANRARVDELSGGRLAYIYMPNTGRQGMEAFDRDFYSQLDKEGVVLDERYNGGGKVADYIIDVLSRETMSFWMNRELWPSRSPFGIIDGPKVMVINEYAGSGGDWMPWTFQNRELGPLVGKRTWGGLVGISGYPPLMDGGSVTAASFGVMDTAGNWAVENVGVWPDHEVEEWPAEIIAGRDPQLEKAVALAMEALKTYERTPTPAYVPPARR